MQPDCEQLAVLERLPVELADVAELLGVVAPPEAEPLGADPIFQGAADFDLELIESRTLDGNILELIYRPSLHA